MARSFKTVLAQQGKALPDVDFFRGDAPITTYIPGGRNSQREKPLVSQREASRHLEPYGGGIEAIDWVMDAIGLYTDGATASAWHLEKDGEKLANKKRVGNDQLTLADQSLVRLLENPNPFMDYAELIELLIIDLMLVGNAYWMKWRVSESGKPLALYRMSPLHVKVKAGPYGIEKYVYQPDGVEEPVEFSPLEVVHFKRPNPHSSTYGLGVVKGGGRAFDLEIALTDATASYMENKADPSMIVQSERRVPRDVFNKLRAQLRARSSGTRNAGELLVLEAGLKAMTLTPSARDAMYAELQDKSRDRILAMFRVHPSLLGIPGHNSGSDKVQDIRREFDNKTLRPFLNKLQTKITMALAAAWDYEFKIDYRYSMPQEEAVKLSGDFGSIPGVKVKEVRRFLVEASLLDEESTGDKEIDDMVLNLPGEELDENGQGGFADRNLPREAGRPPKGENTKAFPKDGSVPAGAKVRKAGGKALTTLERLDAAIARAEAKALIERPTNTGNDRNRLPGEQRPEDSLSTSRLRDTDSIIASMKRDLADAAHPLERALLDHIEGKAFNGKTLTKRVKESEAWKTFQSMIATVMERYAQQAVSTAAVHHGNLGLVPEDALDYEAIAREIVYRKGGVREISENLRSEIVQKVGKVLAEGGGRGEVEQAIRESIVFWKQTQAETVAMTEAVHAYNEGTLSTIEATGGTEVFVTDGEDDDEPCAEADGSVWTIEQARANRLEHPRCRRAFVPLAATL